MIIPAVVGTDGSWRLGPLTGRSTKPVAQYIGATARAAERARRLAELDALIDALAATRDAARDAETAAREARAAIEAWLTGVPSAGALSTAWTRLDERERVTAQADRRAAEAEEVAVQGPGRGGGAAPRSGRAGRGPRSPDGGRPLAARRERLRSLDAALSRMPTRAAPLRRQAAAVGRRCSGVGRGWTRPRRRRSGDRRAGACDAARAAADELEADRRCIAAGDPAAHRGGRAARRGAESAKRELARGSARLLTPGRRGRAGGADAAARLAEQEPVLATAVAALAAVDTARALPSGVGSRCRGGGPAVENAAVFDLACGFSRASPVPAAVLALARRLAELPAAASGARRRPSSRPGRTPSAAPRGTSSRGSSRSAGRSPSSVGTTTGEHPIGELASRLAAAVARDAELLTERERRLFEEHILGDLGESLRARRLEAEELVTEMNKLLAG